MGKTRTEATKPQQQVAIVSDAPLREFVGYHIKRAFNVILSDLNAALKPFELRMVSYSVLVLIVENPGIRQSQLSDALAIDRPNLVVIIDDLEKRDLITRDRLLTDRRIFLLQATPAGQQVCKAAINAVRAHEDALFEGIDEESRANIVKAMRHIEVGLSGKPSAAQP
jgi:DNA-binding MarR family transcriptional regulator